MNLRDATLAAVYENIACGPPPCPLNPVPPNEKPSYPDRCRARVVSRDASLPRILQLLEICADHPINWPASPQPQIFRVWGCLNHFIFTAKYVRLACSLQFSQRQIPAFRLIRRSCPRRPQGLLLENQLQTELDLARKFLAGGGTLPDMCLALLNRNEFVYVP